jgi:hypothetical protein
MYNFTLGVGGMSVNVKIDESVDLQINKNSYALLEGG